MQRFIIFSIVIPFLIFTPINHYNQNIIFFLILFFVLCFFSTFSRYIVKYVRTLSIKKPNIYTSHGHEITRNLHAPFTWKVEVHFVTSNPEWLNKVHLSKNVVFTEGKEKATIYQKRWSRFWSLCHRNNYLYRFWKFLLLS